MSAAHGRTFLFVPGDRPDRFAKAVASGADVVVADLEDAVAPGAKDAAREAVADALATGARMAVRVNAAGTPWHEADLAAVGAHDVPVVLPKADTAAVASLAGRVRTVVALVETARGLLDAAAVAQQPHVARLALGHLDLAAELGTDPDSPAFRSHARLVLAVASAAAGLDGPVDGVTTALRDRTRLEAELSDALDEGAGGKLCIHPDQVVAVQAVLRPSDTDVAHARRVLDASAGGVGVLDGRMVDAPVVALARRVLSRSEPPHREGETP